MRTAATPLDSRSPRGKRNSVTKGSAFGDGPEPPCGKAKLRSFYCSNNCLGVARNRTFLTGLVMTIVRSSLARRVVELLAASGFQSQSPLASSHLFISSAIWSLFLSIIIMCELPLIPRSGKSTNSTLPPAAFNAFAYSTSPARIFDQRG